MKTRYKIMLAIIAVYPIWIILTAPIYPQEKPCDVGFEDSIIGYCIPHLSLLTFTIPSIYATHDPTQPYIHSIILPFDMKEKTFEEFMEWCKPYYGERCTELYEKNLVSNVLPPLKQIQSGIPFNEIQCKDNLVLIHKYDSSPACVENETKKVLVERGWAKPDIRASTE